MDIVFIRDLRVDAVIGIYEWEQRIRQTVRIDLEMGADVSRAAQTDAIEDTLNYKAVAKRVIAYVEDSRFGLIETLAERLAELLLNEFAIPWLRVTVGKPGAVRGSREVGVVVERGERAG
ncbi:MAG: dihydroneopterin aldolase [Gammaproteobacteria bacterium]